MVGQWNLGKGLNRRANLFNQINVKNNCHGWLGPLDVNLIMHIFVYLAPHKGHFSKDVFF